MLLKNDFVRYLENKFFFGVRSSIFQLLLARIIYTHCNIKLNISSDFAVILTFPSEIILKMYIMLLMKIYTQKDVE